MEKHPRIAFLESLTASQEDEIKALKKEKASLSQSLTQLKSSTSNSHITTEQLQLRISLLEKEVQKLRTQNQSLTNQLSESTLIRRSRSSSTRTKEQVNLRAEIHTLVSSFMEAQRLRPLHGVPLTALYQEFIEKYCKHAICTLGVFSKELSNIGYIKRRERSSHGNYIAEHGKKAYVVYAPSTTTQE